MKKFLTVLPIITLASTVSINYSSYSNNNSLANIINYNPSSSNNFLPNKVVNLSTNKVMVTGISTNLINKVAQATDGTIYMNGGDNDANLLYKSTDGSTFSKIDFLKASTTSTTALIRNISIATNGNIYVNNGDNLFVSNDQGKSFNQTTGFADKEGIESILVASNSIVYAITAGGIYKSTDGTIFSKLSKFNCSWIIQGNDGAMYANNIQGADYSGIYKSTDGVNFSKVTSMQADRFAVASNGTMFLFREMQGLFISNDGGKTFNKAHFFDKLAINSMLLTDSGTLFITPDSNQLIISNDQGKTFNQVADATDLTGNIYQVNSTTIFSIGKDFYFKISL